MGKSRPVKRPIQESFRKIIVFTIGVMVLGKVVELERCITDKTNRIQGPRCGKRKSE